MDTLPPVPQGLETSSAMNALSTMSPVSTMSPASTMSPVSTMGPVTTMSPITTEIPSRERVELSTVEKMVIGVAIATTIILIGILVSVVTRK